MYTNILEYPGIPSKNINGFKKLISDMFGGQKEMQDFNTEPAVDPNTNANVEMQRSIQYELGLQQQLTENLKMELTAG